MACFNLDGHTPRRMDKFSISSEGFDIRFSAHFTMRVGQYMNTIHVLCLLALMLFHAYSTSSEVTGVKKKSWHDDPYI